MRLLVTGAEGAVGSYVEDTFGADELHLTDVDTLDVTRLRDLRESFGRVRPDWVLHLAAATDVERCEDEQDRAFLVNATGAGNAAKACAEVGAGMVYVSTGVVFDGEKEDPYVEEDVPNPLSVYGRSKFAGEEAVRSALDRHLILRAGWMAGGGRRDKKFVYNILRRADEQDRIQAVNDRHGTLTYAKQLLEQVAELIRIDGRGTYHAVNEGAVTRFDIARELFDIIGRRIEVVGVPATVFPSRAPRGRSEVLRNRGLERLGINRMSGWRRALAEYVRELEDLGVLKNGRISRA